MAIGMGHSLYFVTNGETPETTLYVQQSTTDVCFDIIQMKVSMFNIAENLWTFFEGTLTRFVTWTSCGTSAAC